MEYFSDQLYSSHIGAVTKKLLVRTWSWYCLILWNIDNQAPVLSHECRFKGILLFIEKNTITVLILVLAAF